MCYGGVWAFEGGDWRYLHGEIVWMNWVGGLVGLLFGDKIFAVLRRVASCRFGVVWCPGGCECVGSEALRRRFEYE